MATLRIISADGSEQAIELRERKLQIGRGRDNDIVLADAEKGVSRSHAELRFENGRYVVVDLQSQNGTWVDGRRVERAEVPPGTEIIIGDYRLRLQSEGAAAGASATAGATIARPVRDIGELHIRARPDRPARHSYPPPAPPAQPAAPQRSWVLGAVLIVGAVILFGAVAWVWGPGGGTAAPQTSEEPRTGEPRPAEPAPAASVPEPPAGGRTSDPAEPLVTKPSSPRKPGPDRAIARVARKPGESVEAWRTRSEALETRYTYSKAALDRRDYAAAAGGFQAILLEEPGFRDAPQLLVQANAGLRATANSLFQSGKRLEAAGDWTGALQKFEQARQIHSGIPGIAESVQRVRERLRAAGTRAFAEAKQLEAAGRTAEALKEYEKAVQWLPADDPNRQIARTRIDQLKRNN